MRRLPSILRLGSILAVSIPLAAVGVPLAVAGSGKITFGGTVSEVRTLELTHHSGGEGDVAVDVRAPGNGGGRYDLILTGADGTRAIEFDGRSVDPVSGQAELAVVGGAPGRGEGHRLRLGPSTDSRDGGHLRLILRSR